MLTKKIMWTNISISIYDDSFDTNILDKAFWIFYKNEKIFSRFDKNSLLSQLNKNKFFKVNEDFIKVVELSKFFYKKTNWYFNPLINLNNIWYTESFDNNKFYKKENKVNLDFDSVKVEWNKVILKENQNLDFGWIVKWWTVDLVANFLKENWIKYFLIDAWWDIYFTSDKWKNINIWINNPINNNIDKVISSQDKANCTSWIYKRKWILDNKIYNHILNPKNNKNNFNILSISIVSGYCVLADVYATTCIAMWEKMAKKFLEKECIKYFIIKKE